MGNISTKIIGGLLVVLFMLAMTTTTQATLVPYTLTDDNSTAVIYSDFLAAGMVDWIVDGVDHLNWQWFWYRVGDTAEASIDTLALIIGGTTDTNFDGDHDTLYLRYGNDQNATQYTVEVRFTLDGASIGSGLSDITEQISITNTGDSSLDFHFFQYSDFDLGGSVDDDDLGGSVDDDTVQLINANAVIQSDPDWTVSETVVTPSANSFELDFHPTTVGKLNDGVASTLGNAFGAGPVGPGDVTWAFQWDRTISPGGAFQISKDKNMIPESATLGLLAVGGLAMLRRKRKN